MKQLDQHCNNKCVNRVEETQTSDNEVTSALFMIVELYMLTLTL